MRKTNLLSATALSLVLTGMASLAISGHAFADTTISTATTTGVATSTSGNTTVNSSGSITLTTGTAITVDSDNTVELDGQIQMSSSTDSSTGILVSGGHTSGLNITADITVTDNFTASAVDGTSPADGIIEGPFAQGTGRYGILSMGTTPFNGSLNVTDGSTILVQGNNSYGIRFENNLNGSVYYIGTVSMAGDNGTGISLENGVTGTVWLGGSINILGTNSTALNLSGNYNSNVILAGSYSGSGYATTSIGSLTAAQLLVVEATPGDIQQDSSVVKIAGNFANGLLFEAPPVTDTTNTSTDQDGDGVVDTSDTTSTITQYGSAPAVLIGSPSQNITIGPLVYAASAVAPPAVDYGFVNRGSITSNGVFAGDNATALQIGGTGYGVTIANGMSNSGTITSSASGAISTALSIQSGANIPLLDVSGSIHGNASDSTTSTVNGTTTSYSTVAASAVGIDIGAGASLSAINVNTDTAGIYAAATGTEGSATAIRDRSNTLTSITNNSVISAVITPTDETGAGVVGVDVNRGIAIDASTNTVGLTLTQTNLNLGSTTIAAPSIVGDILLGSGNNVISSSGGNITGDINFGNGNGASSFLLTNGSVYFGKMTGTGTVAMDISAGTAGLVANSALNLTSLHVGATSTLALTMNTLAPTKPIFLNSGPATFDTGATLDITMNNIIRSPMTFTVMTASSINLGTINVNNLDGDIPYIYEATLTTNAANTMLFANFRLKTQAEAQYSNNEYNALDPVLAAVGQDPGATSALLSQTTKAGFDAVFEQYLPDYSGENLINLAKGPEGVNRELASLTLIPNNNDGQYWMQEYGFKTSRKYGDTEGFNATGFSFSSGREQAFGSHQMLGVYIDYTSSSPLDKFAKAKADLTNSDLTIGGYWRMRDDAFKAWLYAGGGYTQFNSTREVLNASVTHIAAARWSGYSYSGGLGASYDYKVGSFGITPQILTNFYDLDEASHNETGGGDYFDLSIGQRNGHLLTSTALVNFNYNKLFVKPEIWIGYKQNISADIANTVSTFSGSGGTPFTLTGGNIQGGGPVAGFRFSADNDYSYFSLEGDYEKLQAYSDYSISLKTRFQF